MRDLITPWTIMSFAIMAAAGLAAGLSDTFPAWGMYLAILVAVLVAIPTIDRHTERPHR